jgi:hypothetical protein
MDNATIDYHPHLLARLEQRGITPQEVEQK